MGVLKTEGVALPAHRYLTVPGPSTGVVTHWKKLSFEYLAGSIDVIELSVFQGLLHQELVLLE